MNERTRAAILVRASRGDRSYLETKNPAAELVLGRKWDLAATFVDGSAATSELRRRPAVRKLLAAAAAARFDVVVVQELDGVVCAMRELVWLLDLLRDHGVDFVSAEHGGFDTTSIGGRALYAHVRALASFERRMLSRQGHEIARERGKKIGRPRRDVPIGAALELRGHGLPLRKIAEHLGVPRTVLARHLAGDLVPKPRVH